MTTTSSDRIEKQILLRTSKSRVWRALTNAEEFGAWYRVKLDGDFAVGKRVAGQITYPGYEHLNMEVTVERMDDERLFSFRWHPYAVDPTVDYSTEPTTLVEFRLEEVAGGTLLIVGIGLRSHPGRASGRGVPHERRGLADPDGEYSAPCRRLAAAHLPRCATPHHCSQRWGTRRAC